MLEMHDASSLDSVNEVNQWRGKPPVLSSSALAGEAVPLPRLPEEEQPKDTIEQVIQRRGSTRTFDKAASIHWHNLLPFSTLPRGAFRLTSLSLRARSLTIFI